jgi:RimJ/RimL family protein N-acetyltransferase
MVHNQAGIALYKKRGFEIEGVRRHAMVVNGSYVDEYYMGKVLDKGTGQSYTGPQGLK